MSKLANSVLVVLLVTLSNELGDVKEVSSGGVMGPAAAADWFEDDLDLSFEEVDKNDILLSRLFPLDVVDEAEPLKAYRSSTALQELEL
mmetsp:Transcript_29484/g.63121  ORF Transcript_29484/g.63121 Transcript_29484/m.63121 type:complete len:89 (+) Transcript_29484:686-952(+)